MLSSILRSPRAILVNIQIIRAFVQMRELIKTNQDLHLRIDALEKQYDKQFKMVFDAMRRLVRQEEEEKPREIGFEIGGHKL